MQVCKRCLVSGRVQGVFYRASTAERAAALGVMGYAKNLPDGRVEVLACGEAAAVKAFCEWLWQGPPAARVAAVEISDARMSETPAGFDTR
ncbi:MAG TPA: acylphosphatase [Gammaproteobacteria bacterium]|nr:acylphosphatase [Gammaproteobacteria bacterium]